MTAADHNLLMKAEEHKQQRLLVERAALAKAVHEMRAASAFTQTTKTKASTSGDSSIGDDNEEHIADAKKVLRVLANSPGGLASSRSGNGSGLAQLKEAHAATIQFRQQQAGYAGSGTCNGGDGGGDGEPPLPLPPPLSQSGVLPRALEAAKAGATAAAVTVAAVATQSVITVTR